MALIQALVGLYLGIQSGAVIVDWNCIKLFSDRKGQTILDQLYVKYQAF